MWLVGAGYWGSKLLDDLSTLGVTPKVIDIKNGQSIESITTLDPVMLATPLWEHFEQAKYLLARGHDLYVEKPLAENAPQIAELSGLVKPGQLLMVGHLFVHHPQRAEIKEYIRQGWIGKLKHISSRRLNWGIYQTRTDPLLSLAVHDISIVQQFVTERMTVDSVQTWDYSNNPKKDRYRFNGHAGDISYDIDVSWHWPVRTRETIFMGTQGQIVWNQDTNVIKVLRNKIVKNRAVADEKPISINYGYELSPLTTELKHWVDCVSNRSAPLTNLNQALQVALITDQVRHKAQQNNS
jgi:predicted dehydrogenase